MNFQGFTSVEHAWQQYQMLQGDTHKQLLADIQKAIDPSKAGYQSPTGVGSAGELWPLIPEDLKDLVSQVDFKAAHLAFFDWLPKSEAKQTLVQYMRWISHGLEHLDNSTVEGAIAVQNKSAFGRGNGNQAAVKIKQYTETRSITDMLAAVQLAGQPAVPRDALNFYTNEGMLALHRCLERHALFGLGGPTVSGGTAVNPNQIEGVVPQLQLAGQSKNLDGSQLTMEQLEDEVRTLQSAPFYGSPTHVFVTPKVFTSLSRQQVAMARREMNGSGITYGFNDDGLKLVVGTSSLTVKPLVFLDERAQRPPTAGANDGTVVVTPANNAAVAAAADASSKFSAADAGTYIYCVVAFGANGYSAPFFPIKAGGGEARKIVVAAGEKVTLDIANNQATHSYYKVFRTKALTDAQATAVLAKVDAPTPVLSDFQYLESFVKAADGAGGNGTLFVDKNLERTDCGKTLILRQDPAEIELFQLIKMMRLPLARTGASQPFFLLTALGLALKVPEHAMLLTNCAPPQV